MAAEKKAGDGPGDATPGPSFVCALCRGTFAFSEPDDDERREEAEREFGKGVFEREEMAIICDACYIRVMPQGRPS